VGDETVLNKSPSGFVCGQKAGKCYRKPFSSHRAPATLVEEVVSSLLAWRQQLDDYRQH
jgi:hypothetical protein